MLFKKSSRKTIQFILFLFDLFAFLLAIFSSLLLRRLSIPSVNDWVYHIKMFFPVIFYAICTMYLLGLYVVNRPIGGRIVLTKLTAIGIVGCGLGFVFFYFQHDKINFPKTILLYYWIFFCLFTWIIRVILIAFLKRRKIPVVFLGNTKSLDSLVKDLKNNQMLGYKPVFEYKSELDKDALISFIKKEKNNNEVMYVYKDKESLLNDISEQLHTLVAKGFQFIEYSDFYEYIERKIPPEDIGESWFLSNILLWKRRPYFFFKRAAGIILALIGLVLTVWLWPFIALLIHIDSPGSVFFIQEREGRRGKTFNLYKFRSMYVNEQRVTKVGKLLRATRLDELPQFLNVIRGDMSLIGPRPEQPKLALELEKEIPWYNQRLLVRPGITGWDQVCGEYHSASKEDTFKKLQSDLYYIKNCSLFLDISILFKTIGTVFRREGK